MHKLHCDPETEVIGGTMLSIINNLQAKQIQPYLDKHGIGEIDPEKWYPAQRWLDVMNDLMESPEVSNAFVAIGMQVAERVRMPPELENAPLPVVLDHWDDVYKMQHRGGNVGGIEIEKISDTHYKSYHRILYPDDMTYGVAYGWAKRFLPEGTQFIVKYDDEELTMAEGGDATVIHIIWE